MIRPTFIMAGEEYEIINVDTKKLGPEQLIESKLEGYGNSDITTLATDLYQLLSKDKIDEASEIINQYFNDHYSKIEEDVEFKTEDVIKEPLAGDDRQVTFKGDLK